MVGLFLYICGMTKIEIEIEELSKEIEKEQHNIRMYKAVLIAAKCHITEYKERIKRLKEIKRTTNK